MGNRQPDDALRRVCRFLSLALRQFQFTQDQGHMFVKLFSMDRHLNVSPIFHEQGNAQFLLQLRHGVAQIRLGNRQFLRSLRVIFSFCNFMEIGELL